METKKYWWVSYYNKSLDNYSQQIIEKHPFTEIVISGWILINWKEISTEEKEIWENTRTKG